ncbi:MAG: Gfo/Idh/MocA family protein [Limisphaerales bacterium]
MNTALNRRQFIRRSSLAAAGVFFIGKSSSFGKGKSPNEKLNIGIIGVANRAIGNIQGVQDQNIVALCDVDQEYLLKAQQKFPAAKTYVDFRKLLEQKDVDAVVISTPDHTHAVATVAALQSGRHVYCEKPLTRTISEARIISKLAAKHKKLATQMGTQIHATENYRRVVELIQGGAIGTVREVHVWVNTVYTAPGRPTERPPVPAHLNWDLWIGPAPERAYHPEYHPKWWRRYWDFGGGALADLGCHHIDLSHWALGLRYPLAVEAEGPATNPEATSAWMIARYDYPSVGGRPPVKLTWYHGERDQKQMLPPHTAEHRLPKWGSGSLFIGDKGMLQADYHRRLLFPEKDFKDYVPPQPSIPTSIGHHAEWVLACKTGSPTTCNFDYAGALTESVLLGNVAYRVGKRIEWDPKSLKAKNCPEAEEFIQHKYRRGWKI